MKYPIAAAAASAAARYDVQLITNQFTMAVAYTGAAFCVAYVQRNTFNHAVGTQKYKFHIDYGMKEIKFLDIWLGCFCCTSFAESI